MRIVLTSVFAPSVGGMERLAALLATGFAAAGHTVTVITPTPGASPDDSGPRCRVLRRPGPTALLREMRRSDVVLQLGVMLRTAWAAALTGAPVVVSHQTWFDRREGRLRPVERLKRLLTARCANIVASEALLGEPAGPAAVIPNCYDPGCFRPDPTVRRTGDLIFVGRLVGDKGADLLLAAVARLAAEGRRLGLTIVGDGPERAALAAQARALGLAAQVRFAGAQPPAAVARLLNAHHVQVVPSRWAEPFGIVALEGLACGCRLVVADGGGLPEAAGPFGRTFPRNDLDGLCRALHAELAGGEPAGVTPARAAHLARFAPDAVVAAYLRVLLQPRPARRFASGRPAPADA